MYGEQDQVNLERISWDVQCRVDFMSRKGFVVDSYAYEDKKLKVKSMRGIQSPLFGTDFSDDNAFEERYSCKCRETIGKVYESEVCPKCGTVVEFVDVNIEFTGWIILDRDRIIQPLYYRLLNRIVKSKKYSLEDIIKPRAKIDKDGIIQLEPVDDKKPFNSIGVDGLYERFDEILDYFYKKKKRRDLIDMIRDEKDKVFASCIPVYTSALRPTSFSGESNFHFVTPERLYNNIVKKSQLLNKMGDESEEVGGQYQLERDQLHRQITVSELQKKINALWTLVFDNIDTKYGHIREELLGGRVNFSARNVIIPDSSLEADQIEVGYLTFLELYRYEIIGYLVRMTNCTYDEASQEWFESTLSFNRRVYGIMEYIIEKTDPAVIMNRNPTINFGSLMLMRIKRVRPVYDDNHTMAIPVFILRDLNADFDGDILNIVSIKFQDMKAEYDKNFNPKRSLIISRNDGYFNDNFNLLKDEIIGLYQFNNCD